MGVYLLKPVHNAHCLKMSPGCTIEMSDESELLASKLTPPPFFTYMKIMGLIMCAKWNYCQIKLGGL